MKILIINKNEYSGGSAQVCQELINGLEKRGHTVNFFVAKKESTKKNVIPIYNHPFKKLAAYLTSNDLDYYYGEEITKTEEFKQADLIHFHNISGHFFKLAAIKKISQLKPIIWTFHDMNPISHYFAYSFKRKPSLGLFTGFSPRRLSNLIWWNRPYLKLKKAAIYKNSEFRIVSPSRWLAGKISLSVLKNKKIRVINNGIDTKIFRPGDRKEARKKLGLPENKKIILTVADGGKNNVSKGWPFTEKLAKHFKEFFFINIGNKKERTKKNIKLIGKINNKTDLSQYYQAADLLLLPSLIDNFPLVSLEALACGRPVVTFRIGGIEEQIIHKITGYLAKYKNTEDLIAGVNFIMNSNPKELSTRCRQEAENNFSSDLMTEKYLDIYKELLAANS